MIYLLLPLISFDITIPHRARKIKRRFEPPRLGQSRSGERIGELISFVTD